MDKKYYKFVKNALEKVYKNNPGVLTDVKSKDDTLKNIKELIDLKRKIVFDMGCGIGRLAIPISRQAKTMYAVDYSRTIIKHLRINVKKKKAKNVKIIQSDYGDLKFPKECADLIICSLSFPVHSRNWDKDLKMFRRMLKIGGMIIIIESHPSGEYWNIRKELDMKKSLIPSTNKWIIENGFKKHKIINAVFDYKTRKKILKYVKPFFGEAISSYMIGNGTTTLKIKLAIYYWIKKS